MKVSNYAKEVEKWGVYEIACEGRKDGNPYNDYSIIGTFISKTECVTVDGFYDGDGIYKVRFMPSFEGNYSFKVNGNFSEMIYEGVFFVTPPGAGNHGPVRVANTYHFAYEDGNVFYPLGTTCYVWNLQTDERIEQTLRSLKEAKFNKIRFCVFPKHYIYNFGEPRSYPYEGTPMDSSVLTLENYWSYTSDKSGNVWDFSRFNPEHFKHIESCILALMELGIEADLIVMHPYDRWGFSQMTKEEDSLYWKYVIARFSAFRNIWWSLANEYDIFSEKKLEDWEAYASIICEKDPYNHLRSIHNCGSFYDHNRPWITHCSIQRQDIYKSSELTNEWRIHYKKPVVLDEIAYEGNISYGWGNITGEEMVRRFWEAACRGGYPGHGETYVSDDDILWWSHGGELKGESNKRIGFLHKIMSETPGIGLVFKEQEWDSVCAIPDDMICATKTGYHLFYYSFMRPSFREFYFDDTTCYKAEVIDTWDMTIEEKGVFNGRFKISLPGKPYMAIRIRKVSNGF